MLDDGALARFCLEDEQTFSLVFRVVLTMACQMESVGLKADDRLEVFHRAQCHHKLDCLARVLDRSFDSLALLVKLQEVPRPSLVFNVAR